MKFTVTRPYASGPEVDVKLHWETKEKIKKILYFGLGIPAIVGLGVAWSKSKENRPNTPTE